jgi:hypothetical protein
MTESLPSRLVIKKDAGPVYLGDSVYARERRGQLVIYTDNGLGAKDTIVLEPEVFDALAKFAAEVFDR